MTKDEFKVEIHTIAELDTDGYPTRGTLQRIREWEDCDLPSIFSFIKPIWKYAENGYWEETDIGFMLATGGWSGNESIIEAMSANFVFWDMWWESSSRGGHHLFVRL